MGIFSGLGAVFATGKTNEMMAILEDYKRCNEYYTVPRLARQILADFMVNTAKLEKACDTVSMDSVKAKKDLDAITPNIEDAKAEPNKKEQEQQIVETDKSKKSEGFEISD